MLDRELYRKLKEYLEKFPVVSIVGPRQSGKTTLVREVLNDYIYVTLEDLDIRKEASEDPRGFLEKGKDGIVIDEVQHVPELFSYIQGIVDKTGKMGRYVLTGSQNFLIGEKISQSLAGRVGMLELLPFTVSELGLASKDEALDEAIYRGFYPAIYDRGVSPEDYYGSYVRTYVDRDVRTLLNVKDLGTFQTFVKLCAGRVGSLLNMSSLGNECSVSVGTVASWISVLEGSYILYRLRPSHVNHNKRLVKQPKLYFYDTGLLCHLLGLEDWRQLETHYLRGSIFENFILNEYVKGRFNNGRQMDAYFWRDNVGHEVDMVLHGVENDKAVEIKSGKTINDGWFKNLEFYKKLKGNTSGNLIYGGDRSTERIGYNVCAWKDMHKAWS